MTAAELAKSCQQTRTVVLDALAWAANPANEHKLSLNRTKLERVLRRNAAEAERLEHTLAQPGCVAVFGPSQAGKSYLISVLARSEGEEALIAKFDGSVPEVDFIKSINPLGGQEATGLVTRFTLRGKLAPAGFPVCLRLLTQTDILKILVNSAIFRTAIRNTRRSLRPRNSTPTSAPSKRAAPPAHWTCCAARTFGTCRNMSRATPPARFPPARWNLPGRASRVSRRCWALQIAARC